METEIADSADSLEKQIATALASDDINSAEYANVVGDLQRRSDRVTFDSMSRLSRGDLPARRLALDVLARFGEPEWPFRAEVVARLLEMWEENAGDEASDLVAALGHHSEFAPVREKLLPLVDHPDFRVRWHLTHAFDDAGDAQSTAALIRLSRDNDEAIRDWATFALGNLDGRYSPAVRAALIARLGDSDAMTRLEAMHGLVEHGETVVLEVILRACQPNENGENLWDEAKNSSPDYRVLPALHEMRDAANLSGDAAEQLRAAIAACEDILSI